MTESAILIEFKHQLITVFRKDIRKINQFLAEHGFERPDDVDEESATRLIDELRIMIAEQRR